MAIIDTQGLILSTIKYGESSIILKVFTREKGKIDFIISGVRKAKSRVPQSIIQPSFFVHITSYYKDNNSLNRIKEIKPKFIYKSIPFDMARRSVAFFATELMSKIITQNQENTDLYDFAENYFLFVDDEEKDVINAPLFLLKELWQLLGIFPDISTRSDQRPYFDLANGVFTNEIPDSKLILGIEDANRFFDLLHMSYDTLSNFKLSRHERQECIKNAMDYYRYHLPHFKKIQSLEILGEILAP